MIRLNSHRSRVVGGSTITMPMFHEDSHACCGETLPYLGSMGVDLRESPDEKHDGDGEVHGRGDIGCICEEN